MAGVGDEEVVFEFHVSDSWCVDAGFDADGIAGLERCCFGVEAWPFVGGGEADAVSDSLCDRGESWLAGLHSNG